jgi:hypothetical protein
MTVIKHLGKLRESISSIKYLIRHENNGAIVGH